MNYDFPSEAEQELVRKYVMERPLYRPNITYCKTAVVAILICVISVCFSILLFKCLSLLGFFLLKKIYYPVFFILELTVFSRFIAITAIRLYQHYAPEEVRRRCLLKPTCSEYAIIVLKRYGTLIGLIKIWKRLNIKCRGNVYYIDEP